MERLPRRTLVLLVIPIAVFCTAVGLGGGCKGGTDKEDLENTKIMVDQAAEADAPLDCVPDPDGLSLYYIASKGSDRAIFKVDDAGKVTEVYVGAPLVDARGIAISGDGGLLYIADPAAGTGGAVFTLEILGGTPAEVPGTSGTAPRAVDVLAGSSEDEVFFAGQNAKGEGAVYQVPPDGGTAQAVYQGSPLIQPDGIAATRSGAIFVTDNGTDPGKVYKIIGGSATQLGGTLMLGEPAGIALLMDEAMVLVSSLNPSKGTSQVAIMDPASGNTSIFDGVINANKVSGGLHRAHYADLFGWAGFADVYRVKVIPPKPSSTPGGVGG